MNNDTISRQAAINSPVKMIAQGLDWVPVYHIEQLPSAEPEWAQKVEEYRKNAPQHIHNPLAWALYQVWKEYDR